MASSFDLHVLSTPPAFILSQDQTLMFNLALINVSFFLHSFLSRPKPGIRQELRFTVRFCFHKNSWDRFYPRTVSCPLFLRIFEIALLFICQGACLNQAAVSGDFPCDSLLILPQLFFFVNNFFLHFFLAFFSGIFIPHYHCIPHNILVISSMVAPFGTLCVPAINLRS